ncbi:MAG: hypothetical protein J1E80_09090 [Desulfovibrionaceae bacterium]|nr:hypothetical protein [Desulfovibrionaceae bacterium]
MDNTTLMYSALALHIAVMLAVGLHHARRAKTFGDFVIAGGRQGGGLITLSLLASILGGSATLGLADLTLSIGFPAFWWLGVGSAGLLLQAWLLSARVRGLGARTLPDVAGLTVGTEARVLTGLIIAVTWTGIVAAQFTALSRILAALTGQEDTRALLALVSALIILYTAAGGQLSVLRTDALQAALVCGGMAAACVWLYASSGEGPGGWLAGVEPLNDRFGWSDLASLLLLVGGSYFCGPDIFSRNLSARDGATARRSTAAAAALLMLFGLIVVALGQWAAARGVRDGALVALIREYLPAPLALLLGLGLVSALVSSADTCLMSAASILEHDFLRRESVRRTRVFILLIGGLSLGVALLRSDIIGLLLAAYSVYAPGVVVPLCVAVMAHGRRPVRRPLWLAGVATGGLCGFASGTLAAPWLALTGMGLSAVLALAALARPARAAFPLFMPGIRLFVNFPQNFFKSFMKPRA